MSVLNKKATQTALSLILAAAPLFVPAAHADLREEKKIAQFGSPVEWKVECSNWIKLFGVDQCVGHTYKNLQHEYFLVANGPDVEEAVANMIREALGAGALAGIAAYAATPSPEPSARIAAAYAASKAAFLGYLAAKGYQTVAAQYEVRIEDRTSW